jgi:hypothetical protein
MQDDHGAIGEKEVIKWKSIAGFVPGINSEAVNEMS